jgi:hypothetical protein
MRGVAGGRVTLAAAAMLAALAGAAWAQATAPAPAPGPAPAPAPPRTALEPQPIERAFTAPAGRETRFAVFTTIRPDCTSGPLPVIRLIENPLNGSVTVRAGKFRATNVRDCLAMEVPAFIAFYRPKADFDGTDGFLLEVKAQDGKIQRQRFRVTVQGRAPGSDRDRI